MPAGCLVPFPLFLHTRIPQDQDLPVQKAALLLSAETPQVWGCRFPGPSSLAGGCLRGTEPHATEPSPGIPVSSNTNSRSTFLYGLLQRSPVVKMHCVFASGEHHKHGSPLKLVENQLIFTEIVKSLHEIPVANVTLPLLNVCDKELLWNRVIWVILHRECFLFHFCCAKQ